VLENLKNLSAFPQKFNELPTFCATFGAFFKRETKKMPYKKKVMITFVVMLLFG